VDAEAQVAPFDPGLAGQQARPFSGVDNGYLAGYRVRFDEAGPDGRMRISSLLRYAQDIAWRHSEQLGFDRGWYQARGLGWVVRGVELELHEPVPIGHILRVATAVVGHRRIWARRLVECRLASGDLVARVMTDWVLLDGRNRIVRIPEDFGVAFMNPEIRDEILRVPAPPGPVVHSLGFRVRPRDLDPLDHVNNAVYMDWVDEVLESAGWRPAAGPAETWRLEYQASAARGDEVTVDLHGDARAWSARIRRADGLDLLRASGTSGPDEPAGAT
jgi:acyl-ACP thioesterase